MIKKNSSKVLFLLSAAFVFNAQAQINLKLDRDLLNGGEPVVPVISLNGDTDYEISTSQVNVTSRYPVICNRIGGYTPASNVRARINDPNGDNKGDADGEESLMGIQSSIDYYLRERSVNVKSENRNKSLCLSYEVFDVIFADAFADESVPEVSTISYEIFNEPPGGFMPGDDLRYDVIYQNQSPLGQLVDLVEYYPYTSNSESYFDGQSVSMLLCQVLDGNDGFVESCSNSNGLISDVTLAPDHKIVFSVERPISSSSAPGSTLDLMAAVFTKVFTIDSGGSGATQGLGENLSFGGFDKKLMRIPIVEDN